MGATQESTNVYNYLKTNEGKSLEQIKNSPFEINIYVCGDYQIKYFQENITETPEFPKFPKETNYISMAKHKQIKEWHFFFADKTSDTKKMYDDAKIFIDKHGDIKAFDDFGEGKEASVTLKDKTVIIYFNDKYTYEFANTFITKHNQFLIPLIIFVGKKEDNVKLKDEIIKSIEKGEKENINPYLFKFCNSNGNLDNDLINLNMNLIECAAFYNELGDEFKFPKQLIDKELMDIDLKVIFKNFTTINILVCGRPGVGKSTFINVLIKSMICKASKGGECSSRIIKYIHRDFPITFYDTPGISTEEKINNIIDLIKKKNEELKDSKSKIHAVFYLINAEDSRPFLDYEDKMLKALIVFGIPFYFIITRFKEIKKAEEDKDIIIRSYKNLTKGHIDWENITDEKLKDENLKNKKFILVNILGKYKTGIQDLFSIIYEDLKAYLVPDEITNENIVEKTEGSLIGKLNKPRDIIEHMMKLCQQIISIYRIIARSIDSRQKGSTYLSISCLKIITAIFGAKNITIEEYERMIKSLDFKIDEKDKNEKNRFKSWFFTRWYYDYYTPAEEQISYLTYKYINQYKKEFEKDEKKCLEYINQLRINFNEAIEELKQVS